MGRFTSRRREDPSWGFYFLQDARLWGLPARSVPLGVSYETLVAMDHDVALRVVAEFNARVKAQCQPQCQPLAAGLFVP